MLAHKISERCVTNRNEFHRMKQKRLMTITQHEFVLASFFERILGTLIKVGRIIIVYCGMNTYIHTHTRACGRDR